MKNIKYIDCFAGAGGVEQGIKQITSAQFSGVGIEHDTAANTTGMNNGFARIQADMLTLDPLAVASEYFSADSLSLSLSLAPLSTLFGILSRKL